MPLPLPNLDTRRWTDLVDEARAFLPRYAPDWTDHNIHDPGITLIELGAWLTELAIFRANRVHLGHRRKFLELIGFAPRPPLPARTVVAPRLVAGTAPLRLPPGTTFDTVAGVPRLPFRTLDAVTAVDATLSAVLVFDGRQLLDRTRHLADGLPVPALGADAAAAPEGQPPACYFGFDRALPPDETVTLYIRLDRSHAEWPDSRAEWDALAREAEAAGAACVPPAPRWACQGLPPAEWCAPAPHDPPLRPPAGPSDTGGGQPPNDPAHHSVHVVWEYHAAAGWIALDAAAGAVSDRTRGLTLDGPVRVRLPEAMTATRVGPAGAARYYLRCRLAAGRYDEPPRLLSVTVNGVAAEQAAELWSELAIAPGVVPANPPPPAGGMTRVHLRLSAAGVVEALDFGDATDDRPVVRVLDYRAATTGAAGSLTLGLVRLGVGSGFTGQRLVLPAAPVVRDSLRLWTLETAGWRRWARRPDLDASGPTDAHFVLDEMRGEVGFGDGERGRVPPAGALVVAAADATRGAAGSAPAGTLLTLADRPLNRALVGDVIAVRSVLAPVVTVTDAAGADAEDVEPAAGRAAEALWAHERLHAVAGGRETLDRLPVEAVRLAAAPRRAVTLLDFERLARAVPGARVRRARAWAGIDPDHPGHHAPGTVTVVVIPALPADRPQPTDGLLRAVRAFLERRRLVGTRLRVVGPTYLEVVVRARVRARPGAAADQVRDGVLAALRRFLHPLTGGPEGLGWPFGRDVYRSEVLQVIDGVAGVDHVLTLRLADARGRDQCGNLCVPATWLVASGAHAVEVETP
jgi:hypothetical protein